MADTSDSKSDGIGPNKPSHLGSSPSAPITWDQFEEVKSITGNQYKDRKASIHTTIRGKGKIARIKK